MHAYIYCMPIYIACLLEMHTDRLIFGRSARSLGNFRVCSPAEMKRREPIEQETRLVCGRDISPYICIYSSKIYTYCVIYMYIVLCIDFLVSYIDIDFFMEQLLGPYHLHHVYIYIGRYIYIAVLEFIIVHQLTYREGLYNLRFQRCNVRNRL